MSMGKIIKNTAILLAITLVAAIALAFVNNITAGPIAEAQQKAKEDAYRAVLSEADAFAEIDGAAKVIEDLNAAQTNKAKPFVVEVLQGTKAGEKVGYAVTVSAKGYGGQVKLALGLDATAKVVGYAVLDCSGETAGFGARAKDADVAEKFVGITSGEDVVDAISGATHTTEALMADAQIAIDLVKQLEGGNQE